MDSYSPARKAVAAEGLSITDDPITKNPRFDTTRGILLLLEVSSL